MPQAKANSSSSSQLAYGLLTPISFRGSKLRSSRMALQLYVVGRSSLKEEIDFKDMNTFSHVPPGFRFHPTDEELVDYYLRKKIASKRIDLDVIKDVDLYKIEPWDLQELCKISNDEQNEWYFFSHKDKKYPTGTRTNRATKAGFWKATGRDKAIYSKHSLIGMRKTLVFYKGRAPNGQKSDWIMHEYRLETHENGTPQEEGWVVCRVFKKRIATIRKEGDHDQLCWYDDHQVSFMPDFDSPRRIPQQQQQQYNTTTAYNNQYCKQELHELMHYNNNHNNNNMSHHDPFLQLPQLESPKVPYGFVDRINTQLMAPSPTLSTNHQIMINTSSSTMYDHQQGDGVDDQVTDWRVLDKFVASQLSHEDASRKQQVEATYSDAHSSLQLTEQVNLLVNEHNMRQEVICSSSSELGNNSMSTPTSEIDLWK